ncbi:hypothetical protein K7472_24830 [Streptomyces sp. PTM05]|uniref:Uncharacterized protein n=1 Tax=Streptantibioticus parmotrematis TaxID=2873249 RepID=A0ABS7QXV2_9ACTN|nr:hypothetical protein [Streptantibioticus parmotrematis]MBY8888040.1 hypothetical protein [Streptantibioticus parmotrematis]
MTDHTPIPLPDPNTPAPYTIGVPVVVQPPGQPPYYAAPPQIIVVPQQTERGRELSPITTRLIVGGGIGAGAITAFALIGPMVLATLQTLAITALAIGGTALGLGAAAAITLRTFNNNRTPRRK